MNRPWLNFKGTWLGKRIDYDGVYDFQCVDLAKLYLERLGFGKIGKLGNAKQVPQADLFNTGREKIVGTDNLMQGDIIVRTRDKYGHIAIVDRIVDGKVFVLEQNGSGKNSGSGTGPNAIRVQPYKLSFYDFVLRCPKIFENLQEERAAIEKALKQRRADVARGEPGAEQRLAVTLDYQRSIRYQKKSG
ncbi:MAG: CHAP domain-containing protein [candidate division SR1 bacterium]|nr:CHAP domain-containing protein [candidate division SR1 bacterium]